MTHEEIEEALYQKIKAICEERDRLKIDPRCCSIDDIGFKNHASGMMYLNSLISKGLVRARQTQGRDRYETKKPLLF
jgi:hypothetical protein